jgi:hypothetical protein
MHLWEKVVRILLSEALGGTTRECKRGRDQVLHGLALAKRVHA